MQNKSLQKYQTITKGLHETWTPHAGQVRVGQALFSRNCKEIFVQAARNWGKTELVSYCLWRYANLHPDSENYYFSPYMKQSREILWASYRLQQFGPKDWIKSINNTEMRVTFTNGAFIKLDGSDNVDAYRGVKPKGLIVFDEFKDFRPEFYEAFEPNRIAHNCPIIIIGTPPDRECQFLTVANEFKEADHKEFFHAASYENPHIDRRWLDEQKRTLIQRGETDVWEREYEAKYVPGGVSKIFPMLTKDVVVSHADIMHDIKRDMKKLHWYLGADPAAATTFAIIFAAINPYDKKIYILDEIYESEQSKMSVDQIGRRIIEKRNELWAYSDWTQLYDEAATWFKNEMLDRFQEYYQPTSKAHNKKDHGLSLIKDILLGGHMVISDRCVQLFKELDNYYKDKSGKIPKINDHGIDDLRYILGASYYELNPSFEYKEKEDEGYRSSRISDDFPGLDDVGDTAPEQWENDQWI
ncbi:hypothetical protein GOV11_04215 [Candidatus Woesearchaeota archaeon]|nr:hypothetical protein [Candidatus Woesearchaeota archaeon]